MSKDLKVKEDRVRAAMERCPQAKAVLEEIFEGQLCPKKKKPVCGDIISFFDEGERYVALGQIGGVTEYLRGKEPNAIALLTEDGRLGYAMCDGRLIFRGRWGREFPI